LQNQKDYVAVVKFGAYVLLMVVNIAIISIIVKSCFYCFNGISCSQFNFATSAYCLLRQSWIDLKKN